MPQQRRLWLAGMFVGLVFVSLIGCQMFERPQSSPTTPGNAPVLSQATYGQEGEIRFAYQPGATPGLALTADFSRYHKKDQPWAATGAGQGWVVSAEWRDADRHAIAQETAPWTLDANGIGTAQLSATFLNAVFQAAAERYQTNPNDTASWFHRPGLYLNVFAEDTTYGYYAFPCPLSNWSFGGSLSDLVAQLQLGWWPGLAPLTNVAAQAHLGDPVTLQCTPATPVCQPVNPADPCQVQNANDSGAGSLRDVLAACPANGTVTFACGVTDIPLTTGDANTGSHLTLANNVTINGGSGVTIRGSNTTFRVFWVGGATVVLNGLTITGGNTLAWGGGIYISGGTLTIGSTTMVRGNTSWSLSYGEGGGIFNMSGTLTVSGTVSGNTAKYHGGGIFNDGGTLTVSGTVTGNTAGQYGGGIFNMSGTLMTVSGTALIEGNRCGSAPTYSGGGISTTAACPAGVNYGTGNFSGPGATPNDNCNGTYP